jgi:hypothetical protein
MGCSSRGRLEAAAPRWSRTRLRAARPNGRRSAPPDVTGRVENPALGDSRPRPRAGAARAAAPLK